jgi:spermidine/putrescine transport system permease protein
MAERFAVNRLPGFTTIAVLAFLALYIPIITLVFFSFNAGKTVMDFNGFSLQWYVVAWNNTAVQEAAWRSVVIAFWATVIATTVATMAALGTTRRRAFRGQTAVYVAINQPLMVPEIVTAVALLIVFAFAYLPIRARLEGMDLSLETAAADLYATPWLTFRRVTLPLMAPGIVAGAMLAFITSLDDVVITEFVKSAGQDTLPTYMLGQLRRGVTPEVNAISTVLLGLTVVILTAFFLITRERR